MKNLHNRHISFLTVCMMLLFGLLAFPVTSHAATQDITVKNGEELTIPLYIGDTGTINPDLTTITIPPQDTYPDTDSDDSDNELPDNPDKAKQNAQAYLDSLHFEYTEPSSSTVLEFDTQTHQYKALQPGTASITVRAYEPNDTWNYYPVFTATITFTVRVDMTNVTLSQNSYTAYLSPMYQYGKKKPYYNNGYVEFQIGINSSYVFGAETTSSYYDSYTDNNLWNYTYTQSDTVHMNLSLSNNILYVSAYLYKNTSNMIQSTITLTLCDKVFNIPVTILPLNISDQSLLLVKGRKKALTVTGTTEAVQWTSTNPKVATVSSKGVIKGKKTGNCVIIGKVGNAYVGCAVSVTTSQLKKVATYASYMGTHWTYSQAKRTQTGYYDCSALVWKAYRKYSRVNFGSSGYPGVALSEAKWCNAHNKMIKGGFRYKKVRKMQYNPGDLVFKSTNMKKKYADIYHVEMITGYYCYGVSSTGTPYITLTWGARGPSYGAEEGSLLGRPMK
ncbi:MAG: Ig-like domain-containing protein [Lachnospiraceae bacterium]|nr:Ig-like domain-containing protein [Lachnospiraceae bacterium]